jgi:chemotaxis protein CheX
MDQTRSEEIMRFFIWSIWRYYHSITGEEPTIETPYIYNGQDEFLAYNGVINVSGNMKGLVTVSLSPNQLEEVANFYSGYEKGNSKFLLDLIGEICNTVSGNVRKFLGEEFVISTPKTFSEYNSATASTHNSASFVFPITWKEHRSYIIVTLDEPNS